jgi:hypothetical protein
MYSPSYKKNVNSSMETVTSVTFARTMSPVLWVVYDNKEVGADINRYLQMRSLDMENNV